MFYRNNGKLKIELKESHRKIGIYLLLTIGFILSVMASRKFFVDPDGYWHIYTGKWIFENGQVPKLDTFSWYGREHNLPWTNHEWLFDLLIYLVYRAAGLNGVIWGISFLGGVLFLLLTKFLYIRNKSLSLSLIISVFSMFPLSTFMQPRPQSLSFCLLILLCILLEKEKWYWVLPLMVLEVNLHGGFYPMFLIVITYYSYKKKPLLILLSALCVIINPYIYEMYLYTIRNQSASIGYEYISESQRTRMAQGLDLLVLISYILLVMTTHKTKINWQDVLMVFALVGLTFMSERHVVFAYLLIIPILSPYVQVRIQTLGSIISLKIKSKLIKFSILEIAILVLSWYGVTNLVIVKADNLIPKETFPSNKVISYIKENNITHLLNDYNNGGYLLFNDIPTLVDGRGDPFSGQFSSTTILKDYFEAFTLKSDYIKFFKDNNIKYALISKKRPISIVISSNPRFKTLYEDEYFSIYELLE